MVGGIPSAARVARHPAMASRILSRASASVRPWETQPGIAGHSATSMPVSSGSSVTRSFILRSYRVQQLLERDGPRIAHLEHERSRGEAGGRRDWGGDGARHRDIAARLAGA